MKIEFEKIIEKANTRKAVLQELQKLIGDAETYHHGLVELISWLQAMRSHYDLLDQEGRYYRTKSILRWHVPVPSLTTSVRLASSTTRAFSGLYRRRTNNVQTHARL
jgi:hypothetical protein